MPTTHQTGQFAPAGSVVYNAFAGYVYYVHDVDPDSNWDRTRVEIVDHPRTRTDYRKDSRGFTGCRCIGSVWTHSTSLSNRDEILAAPLTEIERVAIRGYLAEHESGTILGIGAYIGRQPQELQVQLLAELDEIGLDLANGIWTLRSRRQEIGDLGQRAAAARDAAQILAAVLNRTPDPDDPRDVVALAIAAADAITRPRA